MINDELNKRVAELRGWTHVTASYGLTWHLNGNYRMSLPDYCTDPAAWGALYTDLYHENRYPYLFVNEDQQVVATVFHPTGRGMATAPGQALCLAYLAAMEARNG